MQTVNQFIEKQKKKASDKISYYKIKEIKPILTNSCLANFRLNAIEFDEVATIDQLIEYLADWHIASHGGELQLTFWDGLLEVKIISSDLEPDYIKRNAAENQALLAILAK
jgi:hypothetical protein